MKISTRSEYAAKALLYLVLAEEERTNNRPAQIPAIASECDIPLKYLEQILVALRNHGILGSRRGVAGGYFLMRSADKITMGEVVRLMDGSNSIASNLPECKQADDICNPNSRSLVGSGPSRLYYPGRRHIRALARAGQKAPGRARPLFDHVLYITSFGMTPRETQRHFSLPLPVISSYKVKYVRVAGEAL